MNHSSCCPATRQKSLLPDRLHPATHTGDGDSLKSLGTALGRPKWGPGLPCPSPRMNEIQIYFILATAGVSASTTQAHTHGSPSHWQSSNIQPEVGLWCPLGGGDALGEGQAASWGLAAPLPSLPIYWHPGLCRGNLVWDEIRQRCESHEDQHRSQAGPEPLRAPRPCHGVPPERQNAGTRWAGASPGSRGALLSKRGGWYGEAMPQPSKKERGFQTSLCKQGAGITWETIAIAMVEELEKQLGLPEKKSPALRRFCPGPIAKCLPATSEHQHRACLAATPPSPVPSCRGPRWTCSPMHRH